MAIPVFDKENIIQNTNVNYLSMLIFLSGA